MHLSLRKGGLPESRQLGGKTATVAQMLSRAAIIIEGTAGSMRRRVGVSWRSVGAKRLNGVEPKATSNWIYLSQTRIQPK